MKLQCQCTERMPFCTQCFGEKFRNIPAARQRTNIRNVAGLSANALDRKLRAIFESESEEESDSDSDSGSDSEDESSSDSDGDVEVLNHIGNNRRDGTARIMTVNGINFRARVNRLENLTVVQLKRYTTSNGIYVPSSTRKAALCAMIRRDILHHASS